MRFNKHYELEGQHAFMGASKHYWTDYDEEKLRRIWENQFKSQKGSRIHDLARILITEKVKMERNTMTLNAYVNDAIGYRMTPEVMLKYSVNCFGTADAISYDPTTKTLRIHDLKTGVHPGHFKQLLIYAALFCHEYKMNPYDLIVILRIYQMDEVHELAGTPEEIERIMKRMEEFDPVIEEMKAVME